MGIAARLKHYMADMNTDERQVCTTLHLFPSQLQAILDGASMPTDIEIAAYADALGLSTVWLQGHPDDRDWLLARDGVYEWGEHVSDLGVWLQTAAKGSRAANVLERMVQVVRLARTHSHLCRQDWFMAGVLGMEHSAYKQFLAGTLDHLTDFWGRRFFDFFHLNEMWVMLGDEHPIEPTGTPLERRQARDKVWQESSPKSSAFGIWPLL